jgi:anhydro-N-acetylmuramic acid kinase
MLVLGIMSGTSCDGLDLCLSEFSGKEQLKDYQYTILKTRFFPFSTELENRLKTAYYSTALQLCELELELTNFHQECIHRFIQENSAYKIDLIACHGHTVFHNPTKGFTKQILLGDRLSEQLNIPVCYDFRSGDVALGGQGAPLVPIGDELLFNQYDACINLGGFANISYSKSDKRIGFDICPFNHLLNTYAQKEGFNYDEDGKMAESGTQIPDLLNTLNRLEYYTREEPKTLAVEDLEKYFWPILANYNESSSADILHTLVIHFVQQIGNIISDKKKILITGGGAFNKFFINQLQKFVDNNITLPSAELISFKEALVFGFLGYLRYTKQINIYTSITGCKRDHSSGKVHFPKGF